MLYYARKIDPKKIDKYIKKINFDTTIKTLSKNKNIIQNYLRSNNIKNFIPDIDIVIPTYDDIHDIFIKNIKQYNTKLLAQIQIFKNNDDILNLAELISRSKCIISLSAGPIHIASNMKISSIGLYPKKDSIYWPTYNKDYVFIDKKYSELSNNEVNKIIIDVIGRLKNISINYLSSFFNT